jgi:hypothetical protein
MRYDNPAHRDAMALGGFTEWIPGRTTGYETLNQAAHAFGLFEEPATEVPDFLP